MWWHLHAYFPLRVQVRNNHILTRNEYYNYYYPKPKYLMIEYMDPLGSIIIMILAAAAYPWLLCQLLETTIRGSIGYILGLYWDNGKENGNYYSTLGYILGKYLI